MKILAQTWYIHVCLIDFIGKTDNWRAVGFQEGEGQVEMPMSGKNTVCLHSTHGRWSGKEREVVCQELIFA